MDIENIIIKRKLYEIELLVDKLCMDLLGGSVIKFMVKPFGQMNYDISTNDNIKLAKCILNTNLDNIFEHDIYIDNDDPLMKYRSLIKNKEVIDKLLVDEIIKVDSY
jgi:hypothetical protein